MFYIIYKITNTIDNKIYVGSHKTSDINDTYMGSGKYLRHAIKKYGLENFTKEILFVFDNAAEMYAKEVEIVNNDFLLREDTYNIKQGGFGGFDYINEQGLNNNKDLQTLQKSGFRHKERLLTDEVYRKKHSQRSSANLKRLHGAGRIKYDNFTGKTHTELSKQLIAIKNSIHQKGEGNSQYGTMWITNDVDSIKIHKNSLIPDGWRKGRKMK